MRVESKLEISAPPALVWEYVSDPSRYLHFMSGITRWEVVGNKRVGLGARYRMLLRVGSAEVGGLIEVVEYARDADLAWTSITGVDQRGRWRLRAANDGRTTVTTLRLSYGAVKGYDQKGGHVAPFTEMGGAFTRATGATPFKLPDSWIAAKSKINLNQKFDFCTTNDIIGGNSGSPVINRNAEVVGLIFDGNIQSLGGDFGYDGSVNRAVAVNSGALKEALAKIYHADRVVTELSR